MSENSVKLKLKGKVAEASEEIDARFTPSIGAEMKVVFDPGEAEFKIDYSKEDSLKLEVRGKFEVVDLDRHKLNLGVGFAHDFLKERTKVDGGIEWTIHKSTKVGMGVSHELQTSTTEGNVSLTLTF